MAKIIEETVSIKFSRITRNDDDASNQIVTEEQINIIDATLQEVLDLPAGVVVEVIAEE